MRCALYMVSWTDIGADTGGVHLCDHLVRTIAEQHAVGDREGVISVL